MKRNKNAGFSLVELIVVIAILAIIVAYVTPQYLRYVENSRQKKDIDVVGKVQWAITVAMSNSEIADRPNSGITTTALADVDDGTHDDFCADIAATLGAPDLATFESRAFSSNAFRNAKMQVDIDSTGQHVKVTVLSNMPAVDDIVFE